MENEKVHRIEQLLAAAYAVSSELIIKSKWEPPHVRKIQIVA